MDPITIEEFHRQDWILAIEALVEYTKEWEEIDPDRAERAWELIDAIGFELGEEPKDLVLESERGWSGPEERVNLPEDAGEESGHCSRFSPRCAPTEDYRQ
jgi:hypothetical protein